MPTLYRKYRPQLFSDLTDQKLVVQTLTNEIKAGTVSHAYLFSGPRGVGKTTTARLLAKALECSERKKGEAEPCNHCQACKEISAGRYLDVIEIDAASQTGVDNIRENIIENAEFKPMQGPFKIFIIDEVHMLSNSAFNALLKTLEEPPSHVIFILATTEPYKLPATVISRCERFQFKKISYDYLVDRLKKICTEEKVKVASDVLEKIASKSDGGLRDAESLLGQILSLGLKNISAADTELFLPSASSDSLINFLGALIDGETETAFNILDQQAAAGSNLDQFMNDLLLMLQTFLRAEATNHLDNSDYNEETIQRIKDLATRLGPKQTVALIELALRHRGEMKLSPLPLLPLELMVIEAKDIMSKDEEQKKPEEPPHQKPPTTEKKIEPPKKNSEPSTNSKPSTIGTTIKNAIAHITNPEAPIKTTLEEIKNKWKELIETVGKNNHSLTFILAMAPPRALNGNKLTINFPYSLHKEKVEELKNRQIIERTLEQFFSEKIKLVCTVVEPTHVSNDKDIEALAAEFGGEVI